MTSSVERSGHHILTSSKAFHSASFHNFVAKLVGYGQDKWVIRWVGSWPDCWAQSIVCNPSVIQSPAACLGDQYPDQEQFKPLLMTRTAGQGAIKVPTVEAVDALGCCSEGPWQMAQL